MIPLPYFPCGLAMSPENQTYFNFTLFLYDSLQLPFGLLNKIRMEPVRWNLATSRNVGSIAHHTWQREKNGADNSSQPDHSQQSRSELSKKTIFHQAGHPLGVKLKYGNKRFDSNLEKECLDIVGNVMILNAPYWSDVSTQFVYCFPHNRSPS